MATPNQRCTCGATVFREHRNQSSALASRWIYIEGVNGGIGSPALGVTGLGGGETEWGLVPYTYYRTVARLVCTNCNRERSSREIDAVGIVGTAFTSSGVYVIGGGSLSSLELVFEGAGRSYTQRPASAYIEGPWWALETPTATAESPGGLQATTISFFPYPDPIDSGAYTATLVGEYFSTYLGLVNLEAPAMLSIYDAQIHPSPGLWRTRDARVSAPAGQLGGEPFASIPFDKCYGVVEFDGALGTPDQQGWSYAGTASQSAWTAQYGVAQFENLGAAQTSYWTKTAALTVAPTAVYVQVAATADQDLDAGAPIEVTGQAALNTVLYTGARLLGTVGGMTAQTLDGLTDVALGAATDPAGMMRTTAAADTLGNEVVWYRDLMQTGTFFGPGAAAPASQLHGVFGVVNNATRSRAQWQSVIVSTPGRFVRAKWPMYAGVQDPVLRLYLRADNGSGTDRTARFLVKTGESPTSMTGSFSQTVSIPVANSVTELAITLSGLAPGMSWISVERDWSHTDDKLLETVHLLHATLRGT